MIYLDAAATTPVRLEVSKAMAEAVETVYGNPSSIHAPGRQARGVVEHARATVSRFVGCRPDELLFTSGGTESIHTALVGAWLAQPDRRHVVTTAVEHHAVLHTCDLLRELGLEVTVVETDRYGRVSAHALLEACRDDTLLVSAMAVNNELGTIQDVAALAKAVKAAFPQVLFHSDMVQALPAKRVRLQDTAIDLASFSAHKVYGPKGIGALYVRKDTPWRSVLRGGAQERERRAGTENLVGIVGFGAAVEWLASHWEVHGAKVETLAHAFREGIADIADVEWNSPVEGGVQGILNVRFRGVRADRLLMRLDLDGVAGSAGSACTAGSLEPSHVLLACGYDETHVRESVRFSLSDQLTTDDVDRAVAIIGQSVEVLRTSRRG